MGKDMTTTYTLHRCGNPHDALKSLCLWIEHKDYPQHEALGIRNGGVATYCGTTYNVWKTKQSWHIEELYK